MNSSQAPYRSTGTPCEAATLSPAELRALYLVEGLKNDGVLHWTFTDCDRLAVGFVAPKGRVIDLAPDKNTGTKNFLDRRELGVLNIGAKGTIDVDGILYELNTHDVLYVSMGSSVKFTGISGDFVLISCPAHAKHPTMLVRAADARHVPLGSQETANERVIHQYIHENGAKSCQLVLGFTEFKPGSVWNTFPPHTHLRRSEIYFYFDLKDQIVMHFMGDPTLTRHLVVRDRQAVISPPWSIHCGCGTGSYKFLWAMAGENMTFDDMDKASMADLR